MYLEVEKKEIKFTISSHPVSRFVFLAPAGGGGDDVRGDRGKSFMCSYCYNIRPIES
jgi:hypothetical protein